MSIKGVSEVYSRGRSVWREAARESNGAVLVDLWLGRVERTADRGAWDEAELSAVESIHNYQRTRLAVTLD